MSDVLGTLYPRPTHTPEKTRVPSQTGTLPECLVSMYTYDTYNTMIRTRVRIIAPWTTRVVYKCIKIETEYCTYCTCSSSLV